MSEWLNFIETESKPKTKVFIVESKTDDFNLGKIKWHPPWRHYCFFPSPTHGSIHSDRCLLEISQFITKLNEEHKAAKKEAGK